MGGISIWQLAIIAVIVVLLFGTKKLRNLGSDLGSAVKGFKKAVTDEDKEEKSNDVLADNSTKESTTESSVEAKDKNKENV